MNNDRFSNVKLDSLIACLMIGDDVVKDEALREYCIRNKGCDYKTIKEKCEQYKSLTQKIEIKKAIQMIGKKCEDYNLEEGDEVVFVFNNISVLVRQETKTHLSFSIILDDPVVMPFRVDCSEIVEEEEL